MSKGSKQRPTNHEAYASAWDKIFGKEELSSDTQGATNVEAAMLKQSTLTGATALPVSTQTAQEIYTNLINRLRK